LRMGMMMLTKGNSFIFGSPEKSLL